MGCREIIEPRTENDKASVPPSDVLVRDRHWTDIAMAELSLNSLEKKRINLAIQNMFLICQQKQLGGLEINPNIDNFSTDVH